MYFQLCQIMAISGFFLFVFFLPPPCPVFFFFFLPLSLSLFPAAHPLPPVGDYPDILWKKESSLYPIYLYELLPLENLKSVLLGLASPTAMVVL